MRYIGVRDTNISGRKNATLIVKLKLNFLYGRFQLSNSKLKYYLNLFFVDDRWSGDGSTRATFLTRPSRPSTAREEEKKRLTSEEPLSLKKL